MGAQSSDGQCTVFEVLTIVNRDKNAVFSLFQRWQIGLRNISYHQTQMELRYEAVEFELMCAKGVINPPSRRVYYWYDQFRKENLGERTTAGSIEILKVKSDEYAKQGIKILYQQDPLVIAVVTPIMRQANACQFAMETVFIDSTGACDHLNHALTFVLGALRIGAVPLGFLITNSTNETAYLAAFALLSTALGAEGFGRQTYPHLIMMDDSDAERSALKRVWWPESNQLLCTFHVAQAVWHWLWDSKHAIKKDHRKVLMALFQQVMYAKSDCDAEQKFSLLMEDETAKMYPCFQKHVQKYWIRKKLWCFAYQRFSQFRGHHTNNFSEVSVRIYKDIVLCRCKAYDAVSLVDFTCTVLEDYYRKRLLDFAHGRNVHSHLLADKVLQRSAYLNKSMIEQISESQFRVPSEKAPENMCDVDVNSGICSCENGAFGGFCKHQSTVMKFFGSENSNAPAVSANSRHLAAVIALGDGAQLRTFYAPLNDAVSTNEKPMIFENIIQVVDHVVDAESSTFVGITDAEIEAAVNALRSGLEKHRNDPSVKNGMQKFTKHATKLQQNASSFGSLLFGQKTRLRFHSRSKIRVQPTSIARRREGITRGSKRIAAGRLASVEKKIAASKRKRCLSMNIAANVPNAKSHGAGH